MNIRVFGLIFLIFATVCAGGDDDTVRIGPGVSPPRIKRKVEPKYTYQARQALVQGTSVFIIVVDEQGMPTDINLVSPLGFGLDEKAQEAIEQWRFFPARRGDQSVKVRAVIEVNFRFQDTWYDEKAERRRTAFNLAIATLNGSDEKAKSKAVATVERLSNEKYPAAMHLQGVWMAEGVRVPRNLEESRRLLLAAAAKDYGPALYAVGRMHLEGTRLPLDPEKGRKLIHEAATLGSAEAQYYLGSGSETGNGEPKDLGAARRYFRLCAASGQAACQFRLAELLLEKPDRREYEYVQAIAWLELASRQGSAPARSRLDRERPALTPSQLDAAAQMAPQLTRKP